MCMSSLEVQSQAVRVEFVLAVAAGHLARHHVAAVLALDDRVGGEHHVSFRQLSHVACPLGAVIDYHLCPTHKHIYVCL